jgi:hypothetical protein
MATYKAEFLSHYYAGRLRPRQAYLLGLIHWEARLAARAPRLANLLTQRRPFAPIGKRIAGVAPQRSIPAVAPQTFRQWWAARSGSSADAALIAAPRAGANGRGPGRVVLWPDTFNDHFATTAC